MTQTFIEEHGLEEYILTKPNSLVLEDYRNDGNRKNQLEALLQNSGIKNEGSLEKIRDRLNDVLQQEFGEYFKDDVSFLFPQIDLSFLEMKKSDFGIEMEFMLPAKTKEDYNSFLKWQGRLFYNKTVLDRKIFSIINRNHNIRRLFFEEEDKNPSRILPKEMRNNIEKLKKPLFLINLPRFIMWNYDSGEFSLSFSWQDLSSSVNYNSKLQQGKINSFLSGGTNAMGIKGKISIVSDKPKIVNRLKRPVAGSHYLERDLMEKIIIDDFEGRTYITPTILSKVPEKTDLKVQRARKIFGEEIYIIEESPDSWVISRFSFNNSDRTRLVDPLVVGLKEEKAYLIDQFDTTPAEDYVRREFTEGENNG